MAKPVPQQGKRSGTIIKLMTDKGFGFIKDEQGTEYFFHRSAVAGGLWDTLQTNQPVSFILGDSPKGPRADQVELA